MNTWMLTLAQGSSTSIETLKKTLTEFFVNYGFQLFGAVLILAAGLIVARWAGRLLMGRLEKLAMEPPTRTLLVRLVKVLILALTLVIAVQKLGVEITPLIAGLGVAGVGVGLAMQGVLGNAVAGLTIIFSKPYRVGEYIEITGEEGQVANIEIFSTTLTHSDGSRVVIPNRKVVGEILHNFGKRRQLNLTVGVAYDSRIGAVLQAIRDILAANAKALRDPVPVVGIRALGASSIDIAVMPWVSLEHFGDAQAEIYQAIVEGFTARGIVIPFPQREVRLLQAATAGTN